MITFIAMKFSVSFQDTHIGKWLSDFDYNKIIKFIAKYNNMNKWWVL